MRQITYAEAIREAFAQVLASDERVVVIGQGVTNPWYVGDSMRDLDKHFGPRRLIDPPVSEQGMNGLAIGAALAGLRPILIHPRMDFLLKGFEQVVNQAANWCYIFGGQASVPLTIRAIINRGGEQGAQHSQALQALFAHIPGLKVVMPATPYDAKGLLIASVQDGNPVVYIDDRWLYKELGEVPEEPYIVPIGKGTVQKEGDHVTLVAISYMVREAQKALPLLGEEGINAELIDLRSVKPWDKEMIISSVRKTGRLVVADSGWRSGGVAAEILATIAEEAWDALKAPPARVALPDLPAPTSRTLEAAYYPRAQHIADTVKRVCSNRHR